MDDPDLPEVVAETIAGLKDIAPTNAREAMLAAQLLATHTAVMDSLGLARTTTGLLSEAHSAMPSGLPMPTPRCPRRLTAPGAATGGSLCWNTGAPNARVARSDDAEQAPPCVDRPQDRRSNRQRQRTSSRHEGGCVLRSPQAGQRRAARRPRGHP